MKKLFFICSILCISAALSAQKGKAFTVPAGSSVEACIPTADRYRYAEFTLGKVLFKDGKKTDAKLNYNFLAKEMEYLQEKDTLAIANENEILQIVVAGDTFLIDKGYLELIFSGKVMVATKQYYNLKEVQKKDSYGTAGSSSATDSYSSIQANGKTYSLITNEDRVYQKMSEYYIANGPGGFVPFTKKKVMQLFPQEKDAIQDYLKSNKINFDSRDDLLRFAGYLSDF